MTRWDITIIAMLAVASFVMAFFAAQPPEHAYVVIERGGAVLLKLPLDEDRVVPIAENEEKNTISIINGTVSITGANCPDKLCMHGSLGRTGGLLVCLPHRLIVRIEARDTEWDVITP